MAHLTLQRIDGSTEKRELSRSQALSIGRQQFNDICVPENDVPPLHCRISWNKSKFEVTAATSEGIEVNSTTVAHVELKNGDVIRVGSLDLVYEDDDRSEPPRREAGSSRKSRNSAAASKPVEDLSLFEGDVFTEGEDIFDEMYEHVAEAEASAALPSEKIRQAQAKGELRRQVRPGEQEILKSPLVLGLAGGGLVLLLLTGIFWFLLGREQSNRLYDQAVQELSSGQFSQSIVSFERFILQYPNHGYRRQAERGLAKSLVLKEISGAAPSFGRGMERLNDLIKAHRNESDFADLHSTIFQYADLIALGAAKAAESTRDPELLVVSKNAQDLLERYADPSTPPTGTIGRINEQRVKADRAIGKQKTFDQAMKSVDAAISRQQPMIALSERERLVKAFPDFVNTKRVRDALQKSMDLERSVVTVDDTEHAAEIEDDPLPKIEPVLGLSQSRSRTDETSQGQLVFVMAKDSCYAIDATTGELVWRRVVGANSPFFPMKNRAAQSAVIMYDSRKQALLSCQLATGKLIWRQPLSGRPKGVPLIYEGQIYLPIEGHALVRIDADTGRISAQVRFSQDLATTPALSRDGNYLLVPGEMAMIYSLSLRSTSSQSTLAVVATTFTDHAAGAVSAPPLAMGTLLLLCDNDLADSAKLRLWDASKPAESLVEIATTRTSGQVRDLPVLRGNQLVVPSAGEQFAAFSVTDEAGQARIAPVGQYRADQSYAGGLGKSPVFLTLGADGQFWSASSAFRRFEIVSDSIRMDSNTTAAGIASQPLQALGDFFFVGRKSRYSEAVTFSAVDRDKLVNPWRCIVGDMPLEAMATRDGGLLWVGESGTLYNVGKNRLNQGGVDQRAGTDLELPVNVTVPLRATLLPDQRMTVAAAGDTKLLFVLNASGQLASKHVLNDFLETDPVLLDDGLVLPLPGRLKLLSLTGGKKSVQEFIAPVGENQQHRWAHLIRIEGRELIACDERGRLARIQFRQGDVAHLAEVAKLQLENPVDVRPIFRGEFLYVADAHGFCRQVNVHSFDVDGQRSLPAPIRNQWSVDAAILVLAGDDRLHLLTDGKELPEKWSFDLAKLEPTGTLQVKDQAVWLACRNGTVLVLNLETGAELQRIELPQSVSLGLRMVNDMMFAVAVDGTLYRLE